MQNISVVLTLGMGMGGGDSKIASHCTKSAPYRLLLITLSTPGEVVN